MDTNNPARARFFEYLSGAMAATLQQVDLYRQGRRLAIDGLLPRFPNNGRMPTLQALPPMENGCGLLHRHLESLLQISLPESSAGPLDQACWRSLLYDAPESGAWCLPTESDPDFIFSYPLSAAPAPGDLLEYCLETLRILLDLADLVEDDNVVFPDEVRTLGRTVALHSHPLQASLVPGQRADGNHGTGRYQPLHSVASTEPAIVVVARHWALLVSFLELRSREESAACNETITGFRLRRTADWIVDGTGHPSEVYEYLARVCNVACKFCYLYGNPSTLAVARGGSLISRDELETRLRYFDPQRHRTLFQAQWEINEFLVDPKIYDLLPRLRERTEEPFYFITNGSPLKQPVVELLAQVKPVHLILSLNSIDEGIRKSVMNERTSQTATAYSSLAPLAATEIPFGISLAAFPDFPLADMLKTIRLADRLPAAFVRVNLPGCTRELPYDGHFDTPSWWAKVVEMVREMRSEVSVPLLTIPSAFEDNLLSENPMEPRVLGTIPGSPGAASGLRPYDIITEVNDFPIVSRSELQSLLLLMRGQVWLRVFRNGRELQIRLDTDHPGRFPYSGHVICKYVFPYGIVTSPSLSRSHAAEIREIVGQQEARRPWILTSSLMKPAGAFLLDHFAPELAESVHMVVADNQFLGGNICVLDMATTGDLAMALAREMPGRQRPDLILVSESGFNHHGRDLQGRHWRDLERTFGIPVRLLGVSRFPF